MQAVITGDIINSTHLEKEDRKHLETVLRNHFSDLAGSEKNYEINRGDSFQVLAKDASKAFFSGILLRTELRIIFKEDIDARFAIGIGDISMQGETLGSSDGTAFQLSGRNFDELEPKNITLGISCGKETIDRGLYVICGLVDKIIMNWSKLQCQAISLRIKGLTYEQIAEEIGVSLSAVYKRINSADFNQIEKTNEYYKYLIKELNV